MILGLILHILVLGPLGKGSCRYMLCTQALIRVTISLFGAYVCTEMVLGLLERGAILP